MLSLKYVKKVLDLRWMIEKHNSQMKQIKMPPTGEALKKRENEMIKDIVSNVSMSDGC